MPLEFARVGFFIHFCFLLVSVGHHDAFVSVESWSIECARAPSLTLLSLETAKTHLPLGRHSFTSSADSSSCCCTPREVLVAVVADCQT